MSYDFKLSFDKTNQNELKQIVNSYKSVSNNLFNPSPNYHMEIDIESDQEISFRIPYKFMELKDVDFENYAKIIIDISSKLNGKTIDLQEEKNISDKTYIFPQPRTLVQKYLNRNFKKFNTNGNEITFYGDEEKKSLHLNLNDFTIRNIDNEFYKKSTYEDFSNLKRFDSEKFNKTALRNWNKKSIRLFIKDSLNATEENDKIWDSPSFIEIEGCGKVQNIVFDSTQTILFSSYKSNRLKLWDIQENKLIQKYTPYSKCIYGFQRITNDLLFALSDNGITFFNYNTGKILLHIYPLDKTWLCFDNDGNYQGDIRDRSAYELDYKDNKFSESFCFIPKLGFATLRQKQIWKLFKLKRFKNPKNMTNLIKEKLSQFV